MAVGVVVLAAGLAVVLAIVLGLKTDVAGWLQGRVAPKPVFGDLQRRMQRIQPLKGAQQVPCADLAAQAPLVLLVLGQSNAANHGLRSQRLPAAITVINGGVCGHSQEPIAGATGTGGSFVTHLPQALKARGETRPVVVALLAVDASSIHEWTAPHSPLRQRLLVTVQANQAAGLPPHRVLWQQGEADARAGLSQADYEAGLLALGQTLQLAGVAAPVLLARSTVCRSGPYAPVRQAMDAVMTTHSARFLPGPDTDSALGPAHRHDGCHLNDSGLETAALLWAEQLTPRAAPQR